jgi:hypothetical protein
MCWWWHGDCRLEGERQGGQQGHKVTQPDGIAAQHIRSHKGSEKSADPKEQVREVEHGRSLFRAHVADQSVGPGHNRTAAEPEEKHTGGNHSPSGGMRQAD